jgi:hypothetical protein
MTRHPLEIAWNTSAADILTAIQHGFRAQVDVKGKLAEFYLQPQIEELKELGFVQNYEWRDEDGKPDFGLHLAPNIHSVTETSHTLFKESQLIEVECKNLRSGKEGIYTRIPGYKVELQKTRNSMDGTRTRWYKVNEFQVLAVCLFNQTKKWEYLFIATAALGCHSSSPECLQIMQRVPAKAEGKWRSTLKEAISDVLSK